MTLSIWGRRTTRPEFEALKAAARQRLAQDQLELDLGLEAAAGAGPLEITASRMAHLRLAARYWDLDDPTRAATSPGSWPRTRSAWSSTRKP